MPWFYTSVLITTGVLMFKVTQGDTKGLGFGVFGNLTQDAAAEVCKHNVTIFGNKEFSFHPKLVKWSVAKDICETACSGRLAEPQTKQENDFIASHIHKISDKCTGSPGYWFGLRRVKGTKKFAFIDRGPLSYSSWIPGEPNFVTNLKQDEECVHYWCKSKWQWNDAICGSYKKFICEKSVPTTESLTTMTTMTKLMSTQSSTGSSMMTATPETMTTRLNLTTEAMSPTTWLSTAPTITTTSITTTTTSSRNTMSMLETTTFPQTDMSISTSFQERLLCKGLKSMGSAKDNGQHFYLVIFVWVILTELVDLH